MTTRDAAQFVMRCAYTDLPGSVVLDAKACLLDILACAVAGWGVASARAVRGTVAQFNSGGRSTLIRSQMRSAPALATLSNAMQASALAG